MTPGLAWNMTILDDGTVIVWSDLEPEPVIGQIRDPKSPAAAHWVLADGTVRPIGGPNGLITYDTLPTFTQFAAANPNYAHLVEAIRQGQGRTEYDVTRASELETGSNAELHEIVAQAFVIEVSSDSPYAKVVQIADSALFPQLLGWRDRWLQMYKDSLAQQDLDAQEVEDREDDKDADEHN